jgi:tetratricopeptide (TPR) repeat protein
MRRFGLCLLAAMTMIGSVGAQTPTKPEANDGEHLGTVSFQISCIDSVRAPFNRGVALLHDFWYDEAERQFKKISSLDPSCAMAHWGAALSLYHQIWNRPDEKTLAEGREELRKAASPAAKTERERAYIAAADRFFKAGTEDYMSRVGAYSAAMADLYQHYPDDVDAGAFYALSLLATEAPDDTSNETERKALAVLDPLFAKFPDNPGIVHYTIHACDTPSLAQHGLAAARHYSEIAYSGAHAVHMPGHIFARLGMWPEDIRDQLASVQASQAAMARHESDGMDQFHSDDFLVYAYLQMGDDASAKKIVDGTSALISHYDAMPHMGSFMRSMFPYYRAKFPVFYALETRDWKAAAALQPVPGAPPEDQMLTYWARIIAQGHLRRPAEAQASFATHEALLEQLKHGDHAYFADSTGAKIAHGELVAWVAFAEGRDDEALKNMRESADLQDKVGQGEVDIPAREMLADMLLESRRPGEALVEYRRSLELSPNRFNGLYHAGRAAEGAGDAVEARRYYAALLKSTDGNAQPPRPELEHARQFLSSVKVASR